jgi:drug/metabolite transporter (DMT)-like permease
MFSVSRRNFLIGTTLAIIAAIMWGFSGVTVSMLFKLNSAMTPLWVSQVRMIAAGLIMLGLAAIRREHPFRVWRDGKSAIQLVGYAVFGLIPVQYCYFKTVEYGNAPIATILQFLGPFVITLYLFSFKRQLPTRAETIGLLLAFFGTLLIVTHGHFNQLAIPPLVLFWGLLSAVGVATHSMMPQKLLPKFGVLSVTGWGMLVGGNVLNLFNPFWTRPVTLTLRDMSLLLVTVLVGTVLAFILFSTSLTFILPTTASLLDAFEPLSATLFAVLLVHTHLGQMDLIGGAVIIVAVIVVTMNFKALFQRMRKQHINQIDH